MPSSAQPTLLHLPDRIKASLQQLVNQTGKPEEELIGEEIEAYFRKPKSTITKIDRYRCKRSRRSSRSSR